MTFISTLDTPWAEWLGWLLVVVGLAGIWRGLSGGPHGMRGLVRSRTGMLGRMEGFRLVVFGLVLVGAGAAIIWQAEWLLLLALGIGFVEILESSTLIAVWRWGAGGEGDG